MLRDKFIHYFQQWRERQLSRGEHWLAQHLAGRSPREKGMLLAAVVFLFSVGYYVLIWQPLSERIEQQETILQQLVAMNTRLKNAAPDIIAARKSATTTPAQVSRVISDSASAHSVVIRRIVFCNNIIQSVNQVWFPEGDVRTTFLILLRITRTLPIQIEPMISACLVNTTGW